MKKKASKSKVKRNTTPYLDSFIDYQDKQYLPGSFLGGDIHPALKAQSKIGGYLMIITGILLFMFYVSPKSGNLPIEEDTLTLFFWVFPAVFSVLLILVGFKFAKTKPRKK